MTGKILQCRCYFVNVILDIPSLSLSRALLRCSISCSFAVMSIYLWIIETCLFYLLLSLVLLPYAILNICVVILYLTLFLLQMTKFSFIRFTRICFKRILFRRDQSEGKKTNFLWMPFWHQVLRWISQCQWKFIRITLKYK